MSEARCPGCGKPVDKIRAYAVKIYKGSFVYFCSPICEKKEPKIEKGKIVSPPLDLERPAEKKKKPQTIGKTFKNRFFVGGIFSILVIGICSLFEIFPSTVTLSLEFLCSLGIILGTIWILGSNPYHSEEMLARYEPLVFYFASLVLLLFGAYYIFMFRSSNLICLQGAIISVSLGLRVWFKERKKQRLKDIGLSSFKETKIERTARHIAFFSIYIGIIFAVLVFGIRFYRQGIEASLFCFISIILASSCYSLLKAGRSAFEVGFNRGKTFGITFKEPSTFFRCSACEMVIFQKSGGLTYNTPLVKEFVPIQGSSEELLGILAGVEERLEVDPIAKAIVQFVRESNIEILEPRRIRILSDLGVEAKSHLGNILIGDRKLFLTQGIALGFAEDYAHKFEKQGKTPVFVALNKELRGIFAIEDKIKSEAGIAISKLLKLGIEPLMITGTTQEAAKNIGQRIGIENVRAEIPSSKHAQEIQLLKERGLRIATVQNQNIAMAQPISGDVNFVLEVSPENINRYDISISGTNLDKIPKAFLISKDVKQTIYQNLSFCFTIVLAGSILGALGIAPPWAVAIFSSLCSIITERGLPIYKKISLE